MRDTVASQSLILESVLPFGVKSTTGSSVLLRGMEGGVIEVPLHTMDFHSDLVSGRVKVGVRKSLPVDGVSMVLGNDLAGFKVIVPVKDVPSVLSKQVKSDIGVHVCQCDVMSCESTQSMTEKSCACESETKINQGCDSLGKASELKVKNSDGLPSGERVVSGHIREDISRLPSDVPGHTSDARQNADANTDQSIGIDSLVTVLVEAVKDVPNPKTKKELSRFLKMAEQCCSCHKFKDVVVPLTDLLKDGEPQWSAECQSAFDRVKAIISSGPVLEAPDSNEGLHLVVDLMTSARVPFRCRKVLEELQDRV